MELIIKIPDEDYKFIKDLESLIIGGRGSCKTIQQNVINAIKTGTPYNPSGDCISRSALKEILSDPLYRSSIKDYGEILKYTFVMDIIDNAPPVNTNVVADDVIKAHENIGYEQGFNDGYAKCVTDNERPQGDCISREAVRSEIWKERVDKDEGCNSEYIRGLKTAIGFINNAQAVDRPKGEWINHRNDYGHNIADCSLCGKTMQWHDEDGDGIPRYCWYCGASMKGGTE